MSNIFGNASGSGGFISPADKPLDMNQFKIFDLPNGTDPNDAINLSQLTSYNPFNQSLNTTDNVRFQNVNMNGQWNIPNSQPSSPNDTNVYNLVARGALVNIPTSGIFRVNLSRAISPSGSDVDTTINAGAYSYVDLCLIIKNSINQWLTDRAISQVFVSTCTWTLNRFSILITNTNPSAPAPWGPNYSVVYSFAGSIAQYFGYTADNITPWNNINQGQTDINLYSDVDWVSSTDPATPISNGSPFVYSISAGKWYITDTYYTPDFLNNVEFNNSNYEVSQGGYTKLVMNESPTIGTSLWGPSGSGAIQLFASNIALRQNSVERFIINNAETYSFSPSRLNFSYKSNTELASFFNNVNRFSIGPALIKLSSPNGDNFSLTDSTLTLTKNSIARLTVDGTNTKLTSPSNGNTLTINDTSSFIYINSFLRFSTDASSSSLRSPGAGTSLELEDTVITLQTSGTNYLELTNTAMGYYKNDAIRLLINNLMTSLYSPNAQTTGGFQIYINDTDIQMMQFPWTGNPFPYIARIQVSSTGSTILRSRTGLFDCRIDDLGSYLGDSVRARIIANASSSQMVSPGGNSILSVVDTGTNYTLGGVSKLSLISSASTLAYNATNYLYVSSGATLVVDNIARYDALSAGNTTVRSYDSTATLTLQPSVASIVAGTSTVLLNADFTYQKVGQNRIHADSSHTQLISPDGTKAIEANDTGVQINLGTDNYKLPTTRGTAGQVLTYSGVNTTWATPSVTPGSAINSGWSFLPMSSITATATAATRSFYYISMVPMNTVITGIKAYINTPGADFINCAIYRGKNLVAGSPLVMTSGRVTVLSTLDANNYMTLPLILQAGQSNQFTAGEYVTIAYHSSGSGAVYYICAAAPANLGISYISTACYASAGTPTFPANLSLVTPSTTNTIRTHFEFY